MTLASGQTASPPSGPPVPSASPSPQQIQSERLVGWVSDGHCTTKHMKEGGEACVRKCIAGAVHVNSDWTPSGMVFITEDKKIWKVDNPDALWGYESKRVAIDGSLDREKGSVRVAKLVGPKPAT
jgi:hypothetical protein